MNLSGSVEIAAPRAAVWAALNDPDTLARCIEGVESLTRTASEEGERLEGKMNAKVGPVRATFSGFVRLTDVVEGTSYRLVGEGKGGVAGFAKGEADVTLADTLTDAGPGTTLSYEVRSSVGGKLAQLGARLIEGTAKAYAESFFNKLKAELEVATPEPAPTPEPASRPADQFTPEASAPAVPAAAAPAPSSGLPPALWASLLILGVLGFLFWQWG
jgi:carbon monoxide dehydrogenase subunit G